MVTVIGHKN